MKSFLLLVVSVAGVLALEQPSPTPPRGYHEATGVPQAARILRQELQHTRVVGGFPVGVGAHPYLGGLVITLVDGRTSICGSSMLSNTRAVTAAHCWWDGRTQASQFAVVYGSDRLFNGGTRVTTRNVELHEGFNPVTYVNDIAIITHPHVEYTDYISPIQIATGTNQYADTWAVAVGYGRSSNDLMEPQETDKRQVNLHVITNANCRLTWAASMVVTSTLCTSSANGMSVCAGDSGGPLVAGNGAARTLIGVVSFGADAGCSFGFPAAHTRVTSYTTWINARL